MLQTLKCEKQVFVINLQLENVKISLSSVKILRENLNNLCLNLMFVMVIVFDLDALYIEMCVCTVHNIQVTNHSCL